MSQKNAIYTALIALGVVLAVKKFGTGAGLRHGS